MIGITSKKQLIDSSEICLPIPYIYRYSPREWAQIGKYAMEHDVSATARTFLRKLKVQLSETTVRSIRDGYLKELKQQRQTDDLEQLRRFPERPHGRLLLLGDSLDQKLQLYIRREREGGGVISSKTVLAAARGIILSYDRSKLAENGGNIHLNRHWAYSFLRRTNFVQRKATTNKSKFSASNFGEVKKSFLKSLHQIVMM